MAVRDAAELDELRLLIVVDNETDMLSSVGAGLPQVAAGAYLAPHVPVVREDEGRPCKVIFDRLCYAGHGLSVLATARRGGEERTVLFDTGPFADLWLGNAVKLGVDLAAIETVFLSHWHFDHSGALPDVVAAIAAARRRAGRPAPVVDLHPDRPDQRGSLGPTGTFLLLPPEPRLEAIAAAGGRIVTHGEPHEVAGGLFLGSGAIERLTGYEQGLAGHHTLRGDRLEPDPLLMDERFLAARVRGRGVTVLSACSHAGVVNACLGADALLGGPIDLVLGGYHLSGQAMEARIEETLKDLAGRIRPRMLAPGHCTGWRAKAALARAFAPDRYAPSVVGSMYALTGA